MTPSILPLNSVLRAALLGAAMLLAAAGAAPAGDPADAPTPDDPPVLGSENLLPDNTRPVRVNSHQGGFQVVFPVGCSKMRQSFNQPAAGEDVPPEKIVYVAQYTCDRFGRKGDGCWVTSMSGLTNKAGEPADSSVVVDKVRGVLEGFGAQLVNQRAISKELGERGGVEGLEVFARSPDGVGELWIRGLLYYHDVFVLVAWKQDGGLWGDPDYNAFFASFLPYADD